MVTNNIKKIIVRVLSVGIGVAIQGTPTRFQPTAQAHKFNGVRVHIVRKFISDLVP